MKANDRGPAVLDRPWTETDRRRLVGLCALISGSWSVAEDLAQETLLEAHRNTDKLTDAAGRDQWLNAIARNVCRRWRVKEARHSARHTALAEGEDVADVFDLEVELEREELARLLDRALALLPDQTRDVLVRRFVAQERLSDIADATGLSPDAVSMRLSRGKLMLRRVLEGELRADAHAYGFLPQVDAVWRPTSLWCPQCGRARLEMSSEAADPSVSFRCPGCAPDKQTACFPLTNPTFAGVIGGRVRPTAIIASTTRWVHTYFLEAVRTGSARCTRCGRPTLLRHYDRGPDYPEQSVRRGVYVDCEACGEMATNSMSGMAIALPEMRSFLKANPRVMALPDRHVERDARPTRVLGFADIKATAQVDVLIDDESLDVRHVHVSTN